MCREASDFCVRRETPGVLSCVQDAATRGFFRSGCIEQVAENMFARLTRACNMEKLGASLGATVVDRHKQFDCQGIQLI
jgi:hypothetical protein